MATFQKHLDDLKWLMYERGLSHVHSWLKQFAAGTTTGTFVAGANMIGNIDCDAAASPGFTSGGLPVNTINPSGQIDLKQSTALEYGSGAVPKAPPGNFR